jgi:hypothetical protein
VGGGTDIQINGVAAGNFEFDISSDNDNISIFHYIINTLWSRPHVHMYSVISSYGYFGLWRVEMYNNNKNYDTSPCNEKKII